MTDAPATPEPNSNAQVPQLRVMGQYVKDLSFENPGAPGTLRGGGGQPQIDMGIDVRARALEDGAYEVELHLTANAKREQDTVFIAELIYGGLFQLSNLDDRARDPFLMIECPRILFPFARRILSDATRDGGFPPLMLEPVDFAGLYRQQLARQQQQQGSSEGGTA
ncbi:protein-export protein SecB [Marinicauda pacifica]|jgi:preprotein translocase subunit SecB|uniref:Protein-export protein SecB n=1 Tax=Marinicauda pacifica TaxID=1133559 RepID=A0A4S2H9F5_9PROT|nr:MULTISPECIES: protein-export chaperone SecB [Marinicauda]TGY92495.1 protein-export chaperone SecB [Marinicauda pacifica]GGE49397.1 protein-export protein SecB [Marinicauda pacifica]